LFEVFFAGGMVGAGGKLAGEPGAPKLEQNVRVVHKSNALTLLNLSAA
jgi:hypothetical protein